MCNNMFENTTDFDFDDDVLLNTSFAPAVNSTQVSHTSKRCNEELSKEKCKKQKCNQDLFSTTNNSTANGFISKPLTGKYICSDNFTSPNRVVKRKFPGPAGLLPEVGASNETILQLLESEKYKNNNVDDVKILSQQSSSVFENGPWKEMTKDFYCPSGNNLLKTFDIRWMKKQALRLLLHHKAPFLAAVIQNLNIIGGKVPTINVTLKDATGDICGTILHTLYEEYSSYFRIGSVVALKHFGVLSVSCNNHCVTITPNNLISIYYYENPIPRKLYGKFLGNIYGESSNEGSVKKITVQNFNADDILRKYDEDVKAYEEEKQKPMSCENLHEKSSVEAGTSFSFTNHDFPSTSHVTVPQFSNNTKSRVESVTAFTSKASSSDCVSGSTSTSIKDSSFTSAEVLGPSTSTKKKFNYKQINITANKPAINENISNNTNNVKKIENCDNILVSNKLTVNSQSKEHAEIWKNLLEGVDTDSLFDDF